EQLAGQRAELRDLAERAPPARPFEQALRGAGLAVIAEFKRRSPSAGWLDETARIEDVAPAYEHAGAAALSVLTDADFFAGSLMDLERARKLTRLPVLRKDFIFDALQVYEARAAGADAILLIVRILEREPLRDLLELAGALRLG